MLAIWLMIDVGGEILYLMFLGMMINVGGHSVVYWTVALFWTCCSSSQVQMFFFCKLLMFVTNAFITCSLPLMRIDICYSNYVHHE